MTNEIKTDNLSDQFLQQSNAMLLQQKMDDLIKETNQFTYIITHDLQAPLRMITGFLELIEKRYAMQLDDTGKQYISYAMKGSVKIKSLIFDLLEYSRVSSIAQIDEEVDLSEILKKVMEDLAPEISTTGARITAGYLPVIHADKRLMNLLFYHIVENAIKFRSSAVPEINIATVQGSRGREVHFTDNGIGIDPAFYEKIFLIFRRLHTDEEKFPGSGTGLAICRKVAKLHGGDISVESKPGNGSVFKVWLPE